MLRLLGALASALVSLPPIPRLRAQEALHSWSIPLLKHDAWLPVAHLSRVAGQCLPLIVVSLISHKSSLYHSFLTPASAMHTHYTFPLAHNRLDKCWCWDGVSLVVDAYINPGQVLSPLLAVTLPSCSIVKPFASTSLLPCSTKHVQALSPNANLKKWICCGKQIVKERVVVKGQH